LTRKGGREKRRHRDGEVGRVEKGNETYDSDERQIEKHMPCNEK
jgi:hypothetical protein